MSEHARIRKIASATSARDETPTREAVHMSPREALTQLVQALAPKLIAYLRSLGADSHLAEDICQQVFVELLQSPVRLENQKHVESCLRKVGGWRLIDAWRRQGHFQRVANLEETLALHAGSEIDPAISAARSEEISNLKKRIAKLTDRDQRILAARAGVDGKIWSFDELANELGMTANAVCVRFHRLIARLREEMKEVD